MGWTSLGDEGYAGGMKPEELRKYQDEFRAMREMLGTFYLELGIPKHPLPHGPEEPPPGPPPSKEGANNGGPDDSVGSAQDQDH